MSTRGLFGISAEQNADGAIRSISLPSRVPENFDSTALRRVEKNLSGKKLAFDGTTDFQRSVWRQLARIPRGKVKTYAEIARAIGRPRASRAVGNACGANPFPIAIPCHRVVASNGGLGGFSGGLDWKKRLLALEGAR